MHLFVLLFHIIHILLYTWQHTCTYSGLCTLPLIYTHKPNKYQVGTVIIIKKNPLYWCLSVTLSYNHTIYDKNKVRVVVHGAVLMIMLTMSHKISQSMEILNVYVWEVASRALRGESPVACQDLLPLMGRGWGDTPVQYIKEAVTLMLQTESEENQTISISFSFPPSLSCAQGACTPK